MALLVLGSRLSLSLACSSFALFVIGNMTVGMLLVLACTKLVLACAGGS